MVPFILGGIASLIGTGMASKEMKNMSELTRTGIALTVIGFMFVGAGFVLICLS